MKSISQTGRIAARRAILWVGLLMAVSLLVMMFGALRAFDAAIKPEMDKRSRLIGASIRDSVENALEMGIPLSSVAGTDRFIENVLTEFDEVHSIILLTAEGDVISRTDRKPLAGRTVVSRVANVGAEEAPRFTLPILNRNTLAGEVVIEIVPDYIRTRLEEVLLDVFVVGLVSVLLAFEFVIFVMAGALGKPLDRIFTLLRMQSDGDFSHVISIADAGHLRRITRRVSDRAVDLAERGLAAASLKRLPQAYFVDVRLPLFVFSTATEISGAFLPLYARDAGGPAWITSDFAATAPLIAYLAAIAFVSPFGGLITRVFAPRTLFLACVPPTALAMVGVGLGQSALWIALWHGLMALAYAAATIACQEYAIRTAPKGEDAQAIGSYLFVILGGAFSGTALGGVLADRIGTSSTLFVGAGLVVIAGILGAISISGNVEHRGDSPSKIPEKSAQTGTLAILGQARFLALIFGVAVPMNIGLSVFVWYLTPLILEAQGASIADIGRTMMIFYLIPVFAGPTIARLADGCVGYAPMLIGGTIIAGCALSSLALWFGFWPMVIAVAGFGFGYAMCDAITYAQAIRLAEVSGLPGARDAGLGALRLIARLAAIAGLLSGAYLAARFDHLTLSVAIGALFFLGTAAMILAEGSRALLRPDRVKDLP